MPLAKPFMELSVFDLFIYTVKSFFFINYGIGFPNSFALRIHVLLCLFCLAACENSKIAGFPVTHTVRPSTSEGSKWSSWGRLPPILPHLLIECACDGKSQNGKMANGEWRMGNGEWGMATGNGEPCQRWRLSTLPSGFVTRCWLHFVNFHSFAVFTNLKICLRWLALAGEMEPVEFVGSPS